MNPDNWALEDTGDSVYSVEMGSAGQDVTFVSGSVEERDRVAQQFIVLHETSEDEPLLDTEKVAPPRLMP